MLGRLMAVFAPKNRSVGKQSKPELLDASGEWKNGPGDKRNGINRVLRQTERLCLSLGLNDRPMWPR